jgi:hypothetical protein
MKNQKWIWIGLVVAIALGGLFYYFSKDEKQLGKGESGDFEPIKQEDDKKVEKISDLSTACKKVYKGWKAWMLKNPDSNWMIRLKAKAKEENTTIGRVLDREFIYGYNRGSYDEKC